MKRLEGRHAVITGAASGIGRAAAQLFRDEGARVLAVDRPGSELSTLEGVETLFQDMTDPDAAKNVVAAAVSRLGTLDTLVNNAGIGLWAQPEETTDDIWQKTFNINVDSYFRTCREAFAVLKTHPGRARIVNTGSVMSTRTDKGLVAYTASKHAVAGMSKALALDWGPHGITCNYVMPGAIHTGMTRASFEDPGIRKIWEKKSPMRRLGEPTEVARVILFLSSDDSSFVTGTGITVDGGLLLRT